MKKTLVIGIVVLLLVAVGIPMAFAANGPGFGTNRGQGACLNAANLTDEQKAELEKLRDQMFETRKRSVQEQVGSGKLTQEQANAIVQRMTERHEAREKNGFGRGMGMGRGGAGRGGGQSQCPFATNNI